MGKNTSITATFAGALLRFSTLLLVCACHKSEVPPAEYPPLDPVPSTVIEANPTTLMAPASVTPTSLPAAADAGVSAPSEPPTESAPPASAVTGSPVEKPQAKSGLNP